MDETSKAVPRMGGFQACILDRPDSAVREERTALRGERACRLRAAGRRGVPERPLRYRSRRRERARCRSALSEEVPLPAHVRALRAVLPLPNLLGNGDRGTRLRTSLSEPLRAKKAQEQALDPRLPAARGHVHDLAGLAAADLLPTDKRQRPVLGRSILPQGGAGYGSSLR